MKDIIVGVATSINITSALSVIRLSGDKSLRIIKKISVVSKKQNWQSHKMIYGWIKDYENKKLIDEVFLCFMRAPKSYTRENFVEIYCHGNPLIVNQILMLITSLGVRLAYPGEFTMRAFLNGRLSLCEAESILDIINAKSIKGTTLAINTLKGSLSQTVRKIKSICLSLLTEIEFKIDFEEDNLYSYNYNSQVEILQKVITELDSLVNTYDRNQLFIQGINLVLAGKPNVGKSSLFNILVNQDKAIVTNIPGTTRDTIDAEILINDLMIKIYDTAGIQESNDPIEKIGIIKTQETLTKANLIFFVVDVLEFMSDKNKIVFDKFQKFVVPVFFIFNKIDKPFSFLTLYQFLESFSKNVIFTSSLKYIGISNLKNELKKSLFRESNFEFGAFYLNQRNFTNLYEARLKLYQVIKAIKSGYVIDILTIDLREAIKLLDNVLGIAVSDTVLNLIFSKFCVGK
uniref:Thiophen and furan oxidation protein n=1 Tax=Cyanidium sp. THAL103 TaxID=3027999 RepID=A0A9Y1I411_9RHOD|nr:thiophen and furan oxidation protein [Cyanidium sp. THAL103]